MFIDVCIGGLLGGGGVILLCGRGRKVCVGVCVKLYVCVAFV